ncbi:MAG: hypothetical protein WD737_13060 [Gemmatimonadota bacterium]
MEILLALFFAVAAFALFLTLRSDVRGTRRQRMRAERTFLARKRSPFRVVDEDRGPAEGVAGSDR